MGKFSLNTVMGCSDPVTSTGGYPSNLTAAPGPVNGRVQVSSGGNVQTGYYSLPRSVISSVSAFVQVAAEEKYIMPQ